MSFVFFCVLSGAVFVSAILGRLQSWSTWKSWKSWSQPSSSVCWKNDPMAMGDCHSWQWTLRKYAMYTGLLCTVFIHFYFQNLLLNNSEIGACIMEITYRYMAWWIFSMVFVSTGLTVVHCRFALRTGRRRTISTSFLQSLVWSFGDGQLVVPEENKKQQKNQLKTCSKHMHTKRPSESYVLGPAPSL